MLSLRAFVPPICPAAFMLVRLGFLISLLATFPLQMAPFRRAQLLRPPCMPVSRKQSSKPPGSFTELASSLQSWGSRGNRLVLSCEAEPCWSRVVCRDSLWKLLFRQQLQGPGLWLVTYLALAGVYCTAAYITSIWEPLIILGSTAGAAGHHWCRFSAEVHAGPFSRVLTQWSGIATCLMLGAAWSSWHQLAAHTRSEL
jgi:hypothetical protein